MALNRIIVDAIKFGIHLGNSSKGKGVREIIMMLFPHQDSPYYYFFSLFFLFLDKTRFHTIEHSRFVADIVQCVADIRFFVLRLEVDPQFLDYRRIARLAYQ